jgi:effector-binding domain-containing protein
MKKLLLVLLTVAVLLLAYLVYSGLFASVTIQMQNMPGYRVMGIQHTGPYEKIGDAFERVHAIADEHGVKVHMIGIYFDNPNETPEAQLRSLAGLVVSVEDSLKLANVEGITALTIPSGSAAVSSFKTSGMVSMIIGAVKSYPKLTEYVAEKNIVEQVNFVYEVYGEGQTEYVMQLAD